MMRLHRLMQDGIRLVFRRLAAGRRNGDKLRVRQFPNIAGDFYLCVDCRLAVAAIEDFLDRRHPCILILGVRRKPNKLPEGGRSSRSCQVPDLDDNLGAPAWVAALPSFPSMRLIHDPGVLPRQSSPTRYFSAPGTSRLSVRGLIGADVSIIIFDRVGLEPDPTEVSCMGLMPFCPLPLPWVPTSG